MVLLVSLRDVEFCCIQYCVGDEFVVMVYVCSGWCEFDAVFNVF